MDCDMVSMHNYRGLIMIANVHSYIRILCELESFFLKSKKNIHLIMLDFIYSGCEKTYTGSKDLGS